MSWKRLALPILMVAMFVLAGCDLLQGPAGPAGPEGPAGADLTAGPASVVGAVSLESQGNPLDPAALTYYVLLDDNEDPTDGSVAETSGTVPGTPGDGTLVFEFTYTMSDVPAGDYYLFAYLDSDGNGQWNGIVGADSQIGTQDDEYANFFGTVDTDFANDDTLRPAGPNIAVPETGYVSADVAILLPGF